MAFFYYYPFVMPLINYTQITDLHLVIINCYYVCNNTI